MLTDTCFRSFWTLTGSPVLLRNAQLLAIADAHGCTPEQAVYRIAQLRGITPLCGSTNEQHLCEALDAKKLDFSASEAAIAEIGRMLD